MKKFKEFGIKTDLQSFTGDKIKIIRILNKEITVYDFKIVDSKYNSGSTKCLHMQIEIGNIRHVVFTGSVMLIDTIQKIPKTDFPFTTTIIKEHERFEFS